MTDGAGLEQDGAQRGAETADGASAFTRTEVSANRPGPGPQSGDDAVFGSGHHRDLACLSGGGLTGAPGIARLWSLRPLETQGRRA